MWSLAGDGWKDGLLRNRDEVLAPFHTPDAKRVDSLFEGTLGLPKISSVWYWPGMSAKRARKKLDDFVDLRHKLAHRVRAAKTVRKDKAIGYKSHVERLVPRTVERVAWHLRDILGFKRTNEVRL